MTTFTLVCTAVGSIVIGVFGMFCLWEGICKIAEWIQKINRPDKEE